MKMIKTKDAPTMGHYELTEVDHHKKDADFRILQINPFFIRWKSGKGEIVNKRRLNKLKKEYNWATDF